MKHVVVIVPEYAHVDEAERVGQEYWQLGPQSGKARARGYFYFQNHDRDDDGHHSIRECLKPLLTHRRPLQF